MRHVIKKEEVAAAWVSQDRDHARTPTGNFSFTGFDRLYSYSTCIASRIETKKKQDVIFVTSYSYSVTTNAQLSILNDLLRRLNHTPIIWTPDSCPTTTSDLPGVWKDLVAQASELWTKASRARQNKPHLLQQGNNSLTQANKLVELFGADVVKGVKADTIEQLQEELRINEAILELAS